MYFLIGLILAVGFFFFLDLGIVPKLIGLGVCSFVWASYRWAFVHKYNEVSTLNPSVAQLMVAGAVGTVLGIISIGIDFLRLRP